MPASNPPSTGGPPAVMYLAVPGGRHPLPSKLSDDVRAELEALHARCLTAAGQPMDAGEALLDVTSRRRTRFVSGGAVSTLLEPDLIDAVVHAASAGYRLCLNSPATTTPGGMNCWIPTGHAGDCELRGWWRWNLLYGYRGPIRLVCTACTPHRYEPVPENCPHRGDT